MRALSLNIPQSVGRTLYCTIFKADGHKLLGKGHAILDDDVQRLEAEGMQHVWVNELEDDEVSESEAAMAVGTIMCSGPVESRLVPGGGANLVATENCCALINEELLRQINGSTNTIAIATHRNFAHARAGECVAVVKSTPFAVARAPLNRVLGILAERGAILQAIPIHNPSVSVLYTDPLHGDRARTLFASNMQVRLDQLGASLQNALDSAEEEESLTKALDYLLRGKPTVILVASTTSPMGPEDVVGRALARIGAQVERFLAPVKPGHLLLLSYKNDIPIVSAPSCFRSTKPNVLDLVLPPLLANYKISSWDIAGLGHGGLL